MGFLRNYSLLTLFGFYDVSQISCESPNLSDWDHSKCVYARQNSIFVLFIDVFDLCVMLEFVYLFCLFLIPVLHYFLWKHSSRYRNQLSRIIGDQMFQITSEYEKAVEVYKKTIPGMQSHELKLFQLRCLTNSAKLNIVLNLLFMFPLLALTTYLYIFA